MYRGQSAPNPARSGDAQSQLASSLLQSVATQAQPESAPQMHSQSLSSPLHPCTNPSSFQNLLKSHRAVVAYFTRQGCPPCRVIGPIFERIAEEKGIPANGFGTKKGPAFTKVQIDMGMGRDVAAEYRITGAPTFMFFLDGQKVWEQSCPCGILTKRRFSGRSDCWRRSSRTPIRGRSAHIFCISA